MTVASLLTFLTALVVGFGVVAAIDERAFTLTFVWFGHEWQSHVRSYLTDTVGLPWQFVHGYVTFAMLDAPSWACYIAIASILGLVRSKWASDITVAFVAAIFLWDVASDYFAGILSNLNVRLVSLFGITIVVACFAIATRFRGHFVQPSSQPNRITNIALGLAIVASLAVSTYGWWVFGIMRQASLEPPAAFVDPAHEPPVD